MKTTIFSIKCNIKPKFNPENSHFLPKQDIPKNQASKKSIQWPYRVLANSLSIDDQLAAAFSIGGCFLGLCFPDFRNLRPAHGVNRKIGLVKLTIFAL